MNFDEFCDLVEDCLRALHGWDDMQVADFVSPRTGRIIQLYQEGDSVEKATDILQAVPPARQYCDK